MKKQVRISPAAHEDILNIYNYVLKDGENIAKEQVVRIYDGIEKIAEFPDIGNSLQNHVEHETRLRYLVINKVYIIVYDNLDTIDILRVFRKDQDFITQLGF